MATVTLTPRLLGIEDLALTATPGETFTAIVLGAGPTLLTKIPLTLLTQCVVAADDTAAAGAGVAVGEVYVSSSNFKLRTRMT